MTSITRHRSQAVPPGPGLLHHRRDGRHYPLGGGRDVGLTANSFNSVSLEPPMVLWSLDKKSSNAAAFMAAEHFAVHILASDQEHVSNRFAKRGIDRFAGLAVERGHGDVPLLAGCSARFECRTAYRHEGGDHVSSSARCWRSTASAAAAGLPRRQLRAADQEGGRTQGRQLGLRRRLARVPLGRANFQMLIPLRAEVESGAWKTFTTRSCRPWHWRRPQHRRNQPDGRVHRPPRRRRTFRHPRHTQTDLHRRRRASPLHRGRASICGRVDGKGGSPPRPTRRASSTPTRRGCSSCCSSG